MERELWKVVYTRLKRTARRFRQKYVHHQPWRIAAVLLWAAVHDRPVSWACDKRNWSATRRRPGAIPSAAARRLLTQVRGGGVLRAEGNYEAGRVYEGAAGSGYQLLAPPDRRDTGRGHRYQSPHRLSALRWFADGLGRALLRGRGSIERMFGNAGSFGGGLGPLPSWVRRLGRVERWGGGKLVIKDARILQRRQKKERFQ